MNKFIIRIMPIFFLIIGSVWVVQAEEMNSPPEPHGSMKPPPEAIEACKGKSEGASVQFTTPRGDTLKGICRKVDGVMVAMPPSGAPPQGGNKPDETQSGKQTG
jgi:hypothetical protein